MHRILKQRDEGEESWRQGASHRAEINFSSRFGWSMREVRGVGRKG